MMGQTMECYLYMLALMLAEIFYATGEVYIDSTFPSLARKGDDVMIKCAIRVPKPETSANTCHVGWSRMYYASNQGKLHTDTLQNSGLIHIATQRDTTGHPQASLLTLKQVDSSMDGHYKCSVMCHNLLQSASVKVKVETDGWTFWSGDSSTLISAVLTVVVVFFILVSSVCLAVKPYCLGVCGRRREVQLSLSSPSSPSASTADTDSLLLDADLPPRYSVVVCTSEEGGHSRCVVEDSALQRRLSQTGSIDSVFIVPLASAPPDYTQALLDLAEKGIIFHPTSVTPMPPSYEEAPNYPLKS